MDNTIMSTLLDMGREVATLWLGAVAYHAWRVTVNKRRISKDSRRLRPARRRSHRNSWKEHKHV